MSDTRWTRRWDYCFRRKNGRHLRVRFSRRGYWLARLNGEAKPTRHSSRDAAKRAAVRRAVQS